MSVIVNQRSKGLGYVQDVPPTNSNKDSQTYYSGTNKDLFHKTINQSTIGFSNGFKTVIYTGNGTGQSITGVGFQPDLVWLKNRVETYDHVLEDSVIGTSYVRYPNQTTVDGATGGGWISSFDSDGFTLDAGGYYNESGDGHVAWCWRCPNDASHASHNGEKYNTETGISIIKYTGDGNAGRTITHSLSKKPKLVIVKCTSNTNSWAIYHESLDATNYMILDTTAALATATTVWNDTKPTDTLITLGSANIVNGSSYSYISYIFAGIENYSSFGSYTGNASTNGPRINCGFEPAFLMIKKTDSTGNWVIYDNKRSTSNPNGLILVANDTDVDAFSSNVDFLEDGFQVTTTNTQVNGSGNNFIYIAFADTSQSVDQFKSVLGGYGTGSDYGYNMGGNVAATTTSIIDRITFPFDSGVASNVGNLSQEMSNSGSYNSSNHGFNIAGNDIASAVTSIIDRITFPFDSGPSVHIGNLTETKRYVAGFNSSIHGFSSGGYTGTDLKSIIDRITFPHDSGYANNIGNLNQSKYVPSSCNSSIYGYIMSGFTGSYLTTIERMSFPYDSGATSSVGNLTASKYRSTTCNSSSAGYCMAGQGYSTIDKIIFPHDSGVASATGNLNQSKYTVSSCNSTIHGFLMGGNTGTVIVSLTERIEFPFNAGTATQAGNLSNSKDVSIGIDGTDFVSQFISHALNV